MHGPGPITDTNPLGWQPHYSLPIRVVDSVAYAVGPLQRRFWRAARDRALSLWPLPFVLEEDPDAENPVDWTKDQYISNAIHLVRAKRQLKDTYHPADYAMFRAFDSAGITVYTPRKSWWSDYRIRATAAIVCHEVGHCLGLWHRSDGGIMAGAWRPDEHDLESIKEYYLS